MTQERQQEPPAKGPSPLHQTCKGGECSRLTNFDIAMSLFLLKTIWVLLSAVVK